MCVTVFPLLWTRSSAINFCRARCIDETSLRFLNINLSTPADLLTSSLKYYKLCVCIKILS